MKYSTYVPNTWAFAVLEQCATCRNMRWNGHFTLILFAYICCASGLLHLLRLCLWFAKLSHLYNLHVSFRYVPVWIFSNIVKYIPFVFRILGSPLWLQQINFSCACKRPSSTDYFSVPCTKTCRWSKDSRETFVCACIVHVTISVCRCLHCDSIYTNWSFHSGLLTCWLIYFI